MVVMTECLRANDTALTGEPSLMYKHEQWKDFERRIINFPLQARADIETAYKAAERGHQGQLRVSGDRFFDHPRAVAIILLDEVGIRDPETIILALLHDTLEDTRLWTPQFRSGQIDELDGVSLAFNRSVAYELQTLTMDEEVFGKEEAEEMYYAALSDASGRVQLVKLADRLHNLRTLSVMSGEKQLRKMQDTYRLVSICTSTREEYPQETAVLLGLIDIATDEARQNLPEDAKRALDKFVRRLDHPKPEPTKRVRFGKRQSPKFNPFELSPEELPELIR